MTERLTGIKGPMFSEKTTTLVGKARRAEHAGKVAQVFKPRIDKRFGDIEAVRSHDELQYPATLIDNSNEILERLHSDTTFVGIDEAQFLDGGVVEVINELLERNIEVVFTGLPLDFRGELFGKIPELLARADYVINLTAVCKYKNGDGTQCNKDATRTQRFVNGEPAKYTDPIVIVGAAELYEARCPDHHVVPGKPTK